MTDARTPTVTPFIPLPWSGEPDAKQEWFDDPDQNPDRMLALAEYYDARAQSEDGE